MMPATRRAKTARLKATKARVIRLEQIAATNTEGRIRTEAELQESREGQTEIKSMIQARRLLPQVTRLKHLQRVQMRGSG